MNRTGMRSIGPWLISMTLDRIPYARDFRRPNVVQYSTTVSVKGKKDLDYNLRLVALQQLTYTLLLKR